MSVRTEADDHLAEAQAHLDLAVKSLSAIVVDRCDGHADFGSEYRDRIRKAFFDTLEIMRSLSGE